MFIELMIILDANIGNPSILSVDDIPIGHRLFSEVFNGMQSGLDELVREAGGDRHISIVRALVTRVACLY